MTRAHRGWAGAILVGAAGLLAATARAGDGAADAALAEGKAPPPLLEVLVPDLEGSAPESLRSADGLQGFVAGVGGGRILTPAVGDRAIFTGTGNQMMAFDSLTGKRLWVTTVDDGGPTAVALLGGRVYFNTGSCTLYALDERSGARKWSHWIAGSVTTAPSLSGDRVFVTGPAEGGGIKIECLRSTTGAVVFRRGLPAETISAPVVDGERIFLALVDGTVMALDLSGKALWSKDSRALAAPWPEGDRVLVASGDAAKPELLSLDAVTGTSSSRAVATPRDDPPGASGDDRQGMFLEPGSRGKGAGRAGGVPRPGGGPAPVPPSGGNVPPPSNPPAPSAPRAAAPWLPGLGQLGYEGPRPCTSSGMAAMATGNTLFLRRVDGGLPVDVDLGERARAAGSAVAAGDLFLVATMDGRLLGFDARTGEPRFGLKFLTPSGPLVLGSSPAVHRGRAYLGTVDGRVIGVDLPAPAADGWSMWGGGPGRSR